MFKHRFQSLILKGKCSFGKRLIAKNFHSNVKSLGRINLIRATHGKSHILKASHFRFSENKKNDQSSNDKEDTEPKQDSNEGKKENDENGESTSNDQNQNNEEETKSTFKVIYLSQF
jgi:hypothetical protein